MRLEKFCGKGREEEPCGSMSGLFYLSPRVIRKGTGQDHEFSAQGRTSPRKNILEQYFSKGTLGNTGDIFCCHIQDKSATSIWRIEVRMLLNILRCTARTPYSKELQSTDANCAKFEKFCSGREVRFNWLAGSMFFK